MGADVVPGAFGVRRTVLRSNLRLLAGAAGATTVLLAAVAYAQQPRARSDVAPHASVVYRDVDLTYPAEATVEAVNEAAIAAQVQGRVIEVRVDAGDHVKAGDVLMRIDEREAAQTLAGSEAQVAQARANLSNAKASYERTKNLYARKFVSSAALDQAESAYKALQAQLSVALANRGQAQTGRSFTTITAPFTGLIAQRHTELGEMAMPGKALISVYDPKSMRVVANVPQYKAGEVRKNLRAKVEFPEIGTWVEASSVMLLPTADTRTHVVQARVGLPEGAPRVVPGTFARAHFVVGKAKKLLMPHQAVARRGDVTAVYVLDDAGNARLRQVRLGEAVDADEVEVLAGLAPGERVMLDPVKAALGLGRAGR